METLLWRKIDGMLPKDDIEMNKDFHNILAHKIRDVGNGGCIHFTIDIAI